MIVLKFRRLRANIDLMGLVLSCHCAFVRISWIQNVFSWVFRKYKQFSLAYFVDFEFFLLFRWSQSLSRAYFLVIKFSPLGDFTFSFWPQNKKGHRNISMHSVPNRFQQYCEFCLYSKDTSSAKLVTQSKFVLVAFLVISF